ncbi:MULTISPECIES: SusC/RagA family TonB-linked outer membrane protein [Butyricimonas]|uniref:SusC/RagA family TonB-linked outer membrane protein n=1 Tax=Butyricimonas TaxID=574697 RepID=UPI0009F32FD6|nr:MULTISPECIES: SusC/RagA family TonB-linked outer membrane protein [Butyricimonas]
MKKNLWTWLLHDKKKEKSAICMKICLCLTFILGGGMLNNTFAQTEKLTLKRENVSMLDIIFAVEKQSKMTFVYSMDAVNKIGKITIDVKDVLIDSVMNVCLRKTDYTYALEKNVVVIKKREADAKDKTAIANKKRIVSGKVLDKRDETLPGVSVYIKGTTIGVVTDVDGVYKIEVPASTQSLQFSFVGMKTQDVKLGQNNVVNVVMEEDVSDLDEVTVVAYGERKKRELISSVSSVKAEDLDELPSASLETLLQGHMAGVEVNNISGSPGGGGSQVAIRGYNSLMQGMTDNTPLYVIDGVPVNSFTSPVTGTNTLAEIDPSTIESVEVLKDAASAALYGSRASNGVILITTKKGRAGRGKFTANVSQSWSILPETPYQVIGHGERMAHIQALRARRKAYQDRRTREYIIPTSYNDVYGTAGVYDYFWNNGYKISESYVDGDRILHDSLNPFYNNATNWWKHSFRTGKILNANLQASGGSETFQYMVGLGWYDEKGIMLGSDFSRVNMISNLRIVPRERLTVDARLYLAYTDRSKGAANTSFSQATAFEGLTVDPKVNSSLYPGSGAVLDETLKRLNETSEKNFTYRVRANMGLSYNVLPGLDLSTTLGIDFTQSKKNGFEPSYLNPDDLSKSTGETASSTMLTNENLLHYSKSFNEIHNLDVMLGMSYTREASDALKGWGMGSPSDYLKYVTADFQDIISINGQPTAMKNYESDFEESVMLSYFGRLAYNFNKKYLTEFTVRRDGSSVFGENVRWATFPSVALGWAFSEESFMERFWWLSYGKIRASWGKQGKAFRDPYLAHGVMASGNSFMGTLGMVPTMMLASDLTWEESDQYDIGLDVDLFDYRLKFKLDYYYKYSTSLLQLVQLPGNVYYHTSAMQNVLEISNEGLELEFLADILRDGPVKWRARFNISRNWNRFEKTNTGMDLTTAVIGRPVQGVYAYNDLGIVEHENEIPVYVDRWGNKNPLNSGSAENPITPGMRLLEDVDGNGRIGQEDLVYVASALPVAHGGFANELKWKGFDLNVLLTYSLGRHIMNAYATPPSYRSIRYKDSPLFTNVENATFWNKPGDKADWPTLTASTNGYVGQFDGQYRSNIEKVNHLRLKQLTLGYNVPKEWLKKVNIEGVRLFLTGENLFLLTNYSGLDPETVNPARGGIDDFSNYPLARKFTLGLTLNF